MFLRRARVLLASGLLIAGLGVFAPGTASAETLWFAFMTGDQVVPGPGDPDADVIGKVSLDPGPSDEINGSICVNWDALDVDLPATAVLGSGAEGAAGSVVVELPGPDELGQGGDCVNELDPAVVQAIIDDPASFFLQLNNDAFPDGAARGQLEQEEVVSVDVAVVACPAGTKVDGESSWQSPGCRTVGRAKDIPTLQPGYTWKIKPLVANNLRIELDDGAGILTLDDAQPAGGGTCDTLSHTCTHFVGFEWQQVFSGDITINLATRPAGYKLAGAVYFTGGQFDRVLAANGSAVHFDTSGQDFVNAILVVVPSGGTRPSTNLTPPPTDRVVAADAEGSAGPGALLALLFVASAAVVIAGARRRLGGSASPADRGPG